MRYIVLVFLLLGCGGNIIPDATVTFIKNGKAQLGVMSEATVKLYELTNEDKKLLATDVSSNGTSIETIGNFRLFVEKLENDKFYLYEISEGKDYDVEDDGVVNDTPTRNRGKFHLLAKGSDIKTLNQANVTVVSEIVYQKVKAFLSTDSLNIENEIQKALETVIGSDLTGDNIIGMADLLKYNPIIHKDKLTETYRSNLTQHLDNILNDRAVEYEPNPESVIKPSVSDVHLELFENLAVGTLVGDVNISDKGDSNITKIDLLGNVNGSFEVNKEGNIKVLVYLDYESRTAYNLRYTATNDAGTSTEALLTIQIKNIFENTGSDYAKSEAGIQTALDNGDNDFILNELLNNRADYADMGDDEVNVNIAAAYIGKSSYTVFDIVGAMNNSDKNSSFNGFIDSITNNGNSVEIIDNLNEADKYYSEVVAGLDCNNTSGLSALEKESCVNLGLVRLTSLSNSIKLLFGGESTTVSKWSEGVDINSSEDLNGNGVVDEADASSCAVVYANNPNNSCREGSSYTYRGKVTFTANNKAYITTLIEVDVGSSTYGYNTFYKLVTNKANNNSPLLTSGVCSKDFTKTNNSSDGINYFPCPTLDNSALLMELKSNIEQGANIQALFPAGSETKETVGNYLKNITGSTEGTIGLDNLSGYLQRD
ncbi:MAG: Unknown protein [uncultured Sulfurovum sp.]|uniref:Cadherin domain-containing protein n=1 Tax=uncultured Sulfurovum sp. TaxID=269237 RepID=A0A6S6T638_9BACT|nr:MAG: Unknown protein [uncultured Sulfurovum sp.]